MYAKLMPLTIGLPQSAQLADGTWVSNYNKLPESILLKEGWLPADEIKPVCTETQTLELDKAVLVKGRIAIQYRAVEVPPDELTDAKAALTKLGVTKLTTWAAAAEAKLVPIAVKSL